MKRTIGLLLVLTLVLGVFTSCSSSKKPINGVRQTKTVDEVLEENTSDGGSSSESGKIVIGRETDAKESKRYPRDTIDIDLTKETPNMVFAIVGDMMVTPENYEGKVVKIKGYFSFFEDNGVQYYSCVVPDATKCCINGIEFDLGEDESYPEDYPLPEQDMTVVGVFDWYIENDYTYPVLRDAEWIE